MLANPNKFWYIGGGVFALLLATLSLGYDIYPQFPSMCVILGIILSILIDSMDELPAARAYDWESIWDDILARKIPVWRGLLFVHAKIIFPTLFTVYLILLIMQKVKIFGGDWQSYASAAIQTLQLLWVTLGSAVLANFSGLPDDTHEITQHSRWNNVFSLLLICILAFGGMWAIFAEIASVGRIAYFVSLGVGILIGIVGVMILTEEDENDERKEKRAEIKEAE